ncbi:single-stranded DNA-binding protein [Christensenella tenuis]|jgi:single-strand DNA-binding protein|uniref:Single-stranded DNA-binding protein n=1 Tax=Christensenella tenuis TaxID=2763033 RepID=A0ABR7EDA7_9FIRM|nr:single-stranded DNA-binding protein [Christensenella tenuis]MBC5647765.1 single-stranded DNA-binding protein [Christensenella tenuis]
MNKAILVGNLTRDPEQRTTPSGVSVTSFTVAVTRRYKSQDGTQQADFINCVAWRSTAEFIAKYFTKGSRIGVVGTIQTRTYDDQNGVRRYVTEVVVDEAEFVTSKAQNPGAARGDAPVQQAQPQQNADDLFAEELSDFQPLDDAELPF